MSTKKTNNLQSFKAEFDPDVFIPLRIREALAELGKEGPQAWEASQEFAQRARLNTNRLSKYREEFADHIVEVKNRAGDPKYIWFADPKVAKEARGK